MSELDTSPATPLTARTNTHHTNGLQSDVLPVPLMRRGSLRRWLKSALNLQMDPPKDPRTVPLGCTRSEWRPTGYAGNEINNRRYSVLTFLPLCLVKQFESFFNIFYLFLALSQFFPLFQVGFLVTYLSPLLMVVCLSLMKDALDEFKRFCQDRRANQERFEKLLPGGEVVSVRACNICVGDLLVLHNNQRIPADCILLHTSERTHTTFVRTDQLDGETDWKLRFPAATTKEMSYAEISRCRLNLRCETLHKDIYAFTGVIDAPGGHSEPIGLENTLWASCVVASGTLVAAVIHTGADTRSAMNTSKPSTKRGLIESELNSIGVKCFVLMTVLSLLLVMQQRFRGDWPVMFIRFFILLSAMIPISMRVNVDVGRLWYCFDMGRDKTIRGTIARNTDLPEELGRLQFLFSDKTGTLTKNHMQFRVLQVGAELVLTDRLMPRLASAVREYFNVDTMAAGGGGGGEGGALSAGANGGGEGVPNSSPTATGAGSPTFGFTSVGAQKMWAREVAAVGEMVKTMVLCHNVNPVIEDGQLAFQASSPDEVALVKLCRSIDVTLSARDVESITFTDPAGIPHAYDVLKMFPFTSERKSMGILVRERATGEYRYYMKGADVKMATVVRPTSWLEESCQELAQVGLRTLVFASRTLTEEQVRHFLGRYEVASATMGDQRAELIERAVQLVESDMTLLGVTGVEDELQDDVVVSLEMLGMCGVKVWILTGDKVETATTIARSTKLIPRHGAVEYLLGATPEAVWERLRQLRRHYDPVLAGAYLATPWTLILDGAALHHCLQPSVAELFVSVARIAYSVVVARCSPTQKAVVVETMRRFSAPSVRMAAIGDGGNDVAMILAAHVGIGIEGVEGRQASLAADFSITQFSHCLRLITWHGRNSYRRTARLSQFIMHRGIVYSVVQAVFSLLFDGTTMSVFNGYLLMGYSTIFTTAPAFAIVLDEDVKESDVSEFPQMYKELVKSRSLNTRTFLQWTWISIFQGGVMMLVSLELFSDEMFQIVTIAYTSLLLTEFIVVAATMHFSILYKQRRAHLWLFLLALVFSAVAFFIAVLVLPDTFDRTFFFSWSCWWRVAVICVASVGPLGVLSLVGRYIVFNRRVIASCFRNL